MAWTMEIVLSVTPIRIPPPINIDIDVALAEMIAPAKAIRGGIDASHFRSSTSLSRPTIGDSTLCMRSGPSETVMLAVGSANRILGTNE